GRVISRGTTRDGWRRMPGCMNYCVILHASKRAAGTYERIRARNDGAAKTNGALCAEEKSWCLHPRTGEDHLALRRGDAAFFLEGDGKFVGAGDLRLGFEAEEHVALVVHVEDAGVNGRAVLRVNDPELVVLVGGLGREVLDDEHAVLFF